MAIASILSTAVSGLHKNAERVHETANRIVNLNSKPVVANPVSNPPALGGGNAIDAQIAGSEQINLVAEVVHLIEAEIAYKANAEVLRTAESLSDYTRDLLA